MTQKDFAKNHAKINHIHFNAILAARAHASRELAVTLEDLTGIDRKIWVWGTRVSRRSAFGEFLKNGKTGEG